MPLPADFRLLNRRTPEGKEFFRSGLCLNHWCQNVAHDAYRCSECEGKKRAAIDELKRRRDLRARELAEQKARRMELGIDGLRKRGTPEVNLRNAAYAFTRIAVANGFLADPKTCKCTDCQKQAECYDHRDYSKPMMVEPVCKRCNSSRGRGYMPPIVSERPADQLKAA